MRIDTATLHIIGAASVIGTNLTLSDQLDRDAYAKVAKVIKAAGGAWDKKAKCHRFADDAEDRIQQMLTTGMVINEKQEFDFFETPAELAMYVVRKAKLQPQHIALEPSAGHGAIARIMRNICNRLTVNDILPRNVEALRAALPDDVSFTCQDFLAMKPTKSWPNGFDRIIMNPPFSKRADIKHVMHAYTFLARYGRLTAIMAAGVLFREDALTQSFKALIHRSAGSIEPLPSGSFKASGTNVNTVLVTMERGD